MELREVKGAALEVAEAKDIPVRDGDEPLTLAGRLRKVSGAFERFVSAITRQYVGHVLGLVKSYWPTTHLDALDKEPELIVQKTNFVNIWQRLP